MTEYSAQRITVQSKTAKNIAELQREPGGTPQNYIGIGVRVNAMIKKLPMKKILLITLIAAIALIAIISPLGTGTAFAGEAAGINTKACISTVGMFGMDVFPWINIDGCVALIGNLIMWIVGRFLWIAGILFNITLSYTLNLNDLLTKIPVVDIGWRILRDIANVVFIFIALWSGIAITLGIDPGKAWGQLAHMVLVALFINFSLFITKVVVDASNIAALHFYNLITPATSRANFDSGLSDAFMNGLRIQTIYDSKQAVEDSKRVDASGVTAGVVGGVFNMWNILLITIFGSILMIVAAFVFFAATVMFMIRAITLIMLMMLSPLAFVSWLLPGASGLASEWWHKLWSQAFFAPLYLALAYVVVATINAPDFDVTTISGAGTSSGFAGVVIGSSPGSVAIVFNFLILIGLMVGCLIVAQHLGAKGADFFMEKTQGFLNGVTNFAGTQAMRGFGMESLKDSLSRKSAKLKEEAETAKTPEAKADLLARAHKYETWSKRTPSFSLRKADELFKRSKFGSTAIGSFIRDQTTKQVIGAKWGGEKSTEETYEESEQRISELRDKEHGEKASKAAGRLSLVRKKEQELQKKKHDREEALAAAKKELAAAKKNNPAGVAAAQAKVDAAKGTSYAKAKKELAEARKSTGPDRDAKIKAAEEKLDDEWQNGQGGGVAGAKHELEVFNEEHGANIKDEMKQIATALARMSTEGFLEMQKSFFARPEIMDISVLGADKYNALMASEHYTNPEKIEYTEARMRRVKDQAERMKKKREWQLKDREVWQGRYNEWKAVKEGSPEYAEAKKKYEEEKKTYDAANAAGVEYEKKKADYIAKGHNPALMATAIGAEPPKVGTQPVAPPEPEKPEWYVEQEARYQEYKDRLAAGESVAEYVDENGEPPQDPSVAPKRTEPIKWDNDELRVAMRNMRDPKELVNYYRYSRELLELPPFVQTVMQGMWNKIRESTEVDSFTKDQNRVNKRLYFQEGSDDAFGLDPVLQKRLDEIDPIVAQDIRDTLNEYVINHSEEEYRQEYFGNDEEGRPGKLNELLKEKFDALGDKIPAELRAAFEEETRVSSKERMLRHDTGRGLLDEDLQNLANDEATMMNGTLRNLHWIKSILNRALFSEFKERDLDVKIPDVENLIHSVGEMFKGNNKLSKGNLDFIVWLSNERNGKEFIPYEQMKPEVQELWEDIKALAKQRDDGLGSKVPSKQAALKRLVERGYFKGQKVESPWRKMGIKARDDSKDDAEFYGDLYNTTG